MTDPKLNAVAEYLGSLPLEQRVPGYGCSEIPGKAEILELLEADEPEWDSQDSNHYQDGYERGEADARTDGRLSPSMRGAMPRPWLEGYEDGRASIEGGTP